MHIALRFFGLDFNKTSKSGCCCDSLHQKLFVLFYALYKNSFIMCYTQDCTAAIFYGYFGVGIGEDFLDSTAVENALDCI